MFKAITNWFLPAVEEDVDEFDSKELKVDRMTEHPTRRWVQLQVKQKVEKIKPLPLDTPVYPDKVS